MCFAPLLCVHEIPEPVQKNLAKPKPPARLWPEAEMMMVEKNPTLRRKSMELLKDLTQILQEIIGSGDDESLRRLEETIRALDESRRKPGRILH